ncbi:MAG: hypothetical protein R3D62_10820 [Xanthobacteraceae bacterium]
MALALDAFKILHIVGAHPEAFPDVTAEASKAARDLVTKQLKIKSGGLISIRAVYKVLGQEAFSSIVDGMKDTEVKTLVTKIDKHHPELKTSNAYWRRNQLCALAAGAAEPSPKIEKLRKKASGKTSGRSTKKTPAAQGSLWSEAMGATRKK